MFAHDIEIAEKCPIMLSNTATWEDPYMRGPQLHESASTIHGIVALVYTYMKRGKE